MISGANKTYDLNEVDVRSLLPQQPPFVMIDRLVYFDPIVSITELEVKEDNIFCEDGILSAYGMIENVAQTCAARIGFINQVSGEPIKLGFIGAIRQMDIKRLVKAGEIISTAIRVNEEVFSMTLVSAAIHVGDECVLSCEMKIALSDINAV